MACSVNQSIALAVHPSEGRFGVSCFIRNPNKASFINSRRKYSLSASPHKNTLVAVVANTPKDRRDLSLLKAKMTDNKDNLDMDDLATNLPAIAALSQEDRAGLVNALKSKLQDLAGGSANVLEALTPKVRKRVDALRLLQSQHDELEAKFLEERAALEARYQKLYQPLYSKRHDIVNGLVEAPDAAIGDEKDAAPEEKGVPHFWLNAMKMHEVLADEITERDEGALEHLTDIKWYRIEEPKGFKLEFVFDTNPFFKNNVLTKTYHMIDEDEPLLEKAIGTEIEWYPGKCLTQKISKKKPKKGGKPMKRTENCPSFFNFFSPPQVPEDDDDIDEEAAEELQNDMEQDYEIGSTIRDKIIPHAVSWFTGEAVQDEFEAIDEEDEEEDEDEDDDDEDEEEDEDDDDDDEDDEEDEKPKARKKVGGKAQTGEQPPECKQQ